MATKDNDRYWLWRRDGWRAPMLIDVPGKGSIPITDCSDEDLRAFAEHRASLSPGGFAVDRWERNALELRERERRRRDRRRP